VTFPTLDDWAQRSEPGIKFYSGTATYTTAFDLTTSETSAGPQKTVLDLGGVQVMARVKVNGIDCGIAWNPPFRVDVTDAVKPGANTLEVAVANLWSNRLTGDQFLPESRRFTWTTWNPYEKTSPLQPSGLLGPVKLLFVK
jgi:hypothetical protein